MCAHNVCDLEPVREPGAGLRRFDHWSIEEIVYQSPVTSIEIPCRAAYMRRAFHCWSKRRQATLETTPLRTAIAEPYRPYNKVEPR